jgi:hypothetical protein
MKHMNPSLQYNAETYATDVVPNRIAASTLRAIIHQEDEDLKALEEELTRLHARIHDLKTKKATVHKSRRYHQASFAPVRELAPEILGEIFIHSPRVAWSDSPPHGPLSSPSSFPAIEACRIGQPAVMDNSALGIGIYARPPHNDANGS